MTVGRQLIIVETGEKSYKWFRMTARKAATMVIDSQNLGTRQEASIATTVWSSLQHSSLSFSNSKARPTLRLHATRMARASAMSDVLMSRMRDVSDSRNDATTALTTTRKEALTSQARRVI